jgi:lipoate-protein ligase A
VGRKLVGSAQVRIGGSILQHGSLILDGDQNGLSEIRADGLPVPPPATLRGLLGEVPSWDELALALQAGLADTLGGSWMPASFSSVELDAARRWEEQYRDPKWTWRV